MYQSPVLENDRNMPIDEPDTNYRPHLILINNLSMKTILIDVWLHQSEKITWKSLNLETQIKDSRERKMFRKFQ